MDIFNITQIVVNPLFLDLYVAGLIALTAQRLLTAEARLRWERRDAAEVTECILSNEPNTLRLIRLRKLVSENVFGKDFGPEGAVRRSVLTFLSAIEEVPRRRHVSEGLRPSKAFFEAELARSMPRVSNFGDTIIRLSLIGTFAGLIAALTIASTNIGSGLAQGSNATSEMQNFLEQLLSSAAVKFWISAVGLVLALVLRVWQGRLDRSIGKIAGQLGRIFDLALDDANVLQDWNCKVEDDAISQQIYEIAEQIRANADKWILTIQIGGAGGAPKVPRVELSRRL